MKKLLMVSTLLASVSIGPAYAQEGQKNDIAISAEQAESQGIKTMALSSVTQGAGAGFPAKAVIPNNQLRVIGAPLEGIIESMVVAAGQPVKKGDLLAELKSPAMVDEQRQFLHALSSAQVARSAMSRDDELLKEGIIAKSRNQSTRSTYNQAEADLSEKRQSLEMYGMSVADIKALEKNQKISNSLKITAPLNGFVLEQSAIAGQRVEAATPLYKIGSLTPMWVEISMPAAQAARIKEGDVVSVQDADATGKVISVGKSLDTANQTIMVRGEITENAEKLHPEQLVVAAIQSVGTNAKKWQLPANAVARQDGKPFVFVKTPSGFRAQEVTVESQNATLTTISGPLSDGDHVVVQGVLSVKGKWQGLGGGE